MDKVYRVTPKKYGKVTKWIVQRCVDRKQIGNAFGLKTEANSYEADLMAKIAEVKNVSNDGATFVEAFKNFAKSITTSLYSININVFFRPSCPGVEF